MEDKILPDPKIWGKQVKDQYNDSNMPYYIRDIVSSERVKKWASKIFPKMNTKYGAYETDIALLQVKAHLI